MSKVSCVMPTYRRFTCVERAIAGFLSQETDIDTELIICNTDVHHPLLLDDTFSEYDRSRIKIYNNNTDSVTDVPYTSTGAIRRDGVALSSGEYYITWDDDDIYLPWNIQQCYDGIVRTDARAWKPKKSIVWTANSPELAHNVLEATAIMHIAEATFDNNSGPEGLSWYLRLQRSGQLVEDDYSIPGYCYYWRDPGHIGGHKQGNAADINRSDNFVWHMSNCGDVAVRPLTKRNIIEYAEIIESLRNIFSALRSEKSELYEKYVKNFFN